jgi:hypothetical protein
MQLTEKQRKAALAAIRILGGEKEFGAPAEELLDSMLEIETMIQDNAASVKGSCRRNVPFAQMEFHTVGLS